MTAGSEAFVGAVLRHLRSFEEERYQDQLDLLLLGQTVPPCPMRWPDPDCPDCWGEGWVCGCHGFALSYRHGRSKPRERCPCRDRGRRRAG